ncbi:hypothetical protein V5738_10955 [Salinisphaera sp. SPP-AMP-43]|uniref:hypothetical protein n=1 Tax=Salinisphaera sp. SPP-AMP-43 TaxID=3121288 RepID=UPI003C6DF2ED
MSRYVVVDHPGHIDLQLIVRRSLFGRILKGELATRAELDRYTPVGRCQPVGTVSDSRESLLCDKQS